MPDVREGEGAAGGRGGMLQGRQMARRRASGHALAGVISIERT